MNKDDVTIKHCKVSDKVEVSYHVISADRDYKLEDGDQPHPDLVEAIKAFQNDLAFAFLHDDNEKIEAFKASGFTITENMGVTHIVITGSVKTVHDRTVGLSSGKIPVDVEDKKDPLTKKIDKAIEELYQFTFKGKKSQQEIDFDEEK